MSSGAALRTTTMYSSATASDAPMPPPRPKAEPIKPPRRSRLPPSPPPSPASSRSPHSAPAPPVPKKPVPKAPATSAIPSSLHRPDSTLPKRTLPPAPTSTSSPAALSNIITLAHPPRVPVPPPRSFTAPPVSGSPSIPSPSPAFLRSVPTKPDRPVPTPPLRGPLSPPITTIEALSLKDTPSRTQNRPGSHIVKNLPDSQGTASPVPLPPSKPPKLPPKIAARTSLDVQIEQSTPPPSPPPRSTLPARPTPPPRPPLPQRSELPQPPELPHRSELEQESSSSDKSSERPSTNSSSSSSDTSPESSPPELPHESELEQESSSCDKSSETLSTKSSSSSSNTSPESSPPELPHQSELEQDSTLSDKSSVTPSTNSSSSASYTSPESSPPELPHRSELEKDSTSFEVTSSTNNSSSSRHTSPESSNPSPSSSPSLSSSACFHSTGEENTHLSTLARSKPVFTSDFSGERLDLTLIDFSDPDNHAISCPEAETASIKRLSWYLTSPFPGDQLAQLRAVFSWVVNNIEYNMVGLLSGNRGDNSAEGVLRNRTGVCAGYANLFEALTAPYGVTQVYGMARGVGVEVGDGSLGGAHAWNAVTIHGERLFIDSTWGAGSVCPYKPDTPKQMEPYYFLVRPEQLIYSHWPTRAEHQFLDPPVQVEVYRALPFRTSKSWTLGIAPTGRFTSQTVKTEDDSFEVDVSLAKRSWDKAFARVSVRLEWKTPTTLTTTTEFKPMVHWLREDDDAVIITIKGLCPGPGYGVLRVFGASPDDKESEYEGAISYKVVNEGSGANWRPLMETYSATGFSFSVLEPNTAHVQSGVMQTIRVRIFQVEPGRARPKIVLFRGNKPEPMKEVDADVFETRKVLQPGQYEVGCTSTQNSWSILCVFDAL